MREVFEVQISRIKIDPLSLQMIWKIQDLGDRKDRTLGMGILYRRLTTPDRKRRAVQLNRETADITLEIKRKQLRGLDIEVSVTIPGELGH